MSERAHGIVFMQLFLGPVLQWDRASAPSGMQLPWGHSPFSAWPVWWGQSSSFAAWCRDPSLQWGQAPAGDSAPTVLHTLQPISTYAWLFIAGSDVDLDQVEDNKVIFRFISQLVKGNRLCWLQTGTA